MKNYWLEKFKSEHVLLKNLWNVLSEKWKKDDEDQENLYKFRIPLNMVAFISRRLMEQTDIANKEQKTYENKYKTIKVRILIEKHRGNDFYKDVESMQYLDTFKNKKESEVDLYDVCNYIIHERRSSYADDMFSYDNSGNKIIKSSDDTLFFYHIETHNLKIRANKDKNISWFFALSSEKKGDVLIDIKSLMKSFEYFIEIYEN